MNCIYIASLLRTFFSTQKQRNPDNRLVSRYELFSRGMLVFVITLFAGTLTGQVFFTESFETTGDYTAGSGGDCGCVTADFDAIDGQNDHFADVTDVDITHNFVADYTGEVDAAGNVTEGTARYWAAEDIDDPQVGTGATGCLTLSVNITGRTNLEFRGLFGGHNSSIIFKSFEN